MSLRSVFTVLLGVCFALTTAVSFANILVDEDFDGAGVFADRGYTAPGYNMMNPPTSVTQTRIDSTQGINCAYMSSESTAPRTVIANTGTVVTETYFSAPKSLKLTSGQSVVRTWGGDLSGTDWSRRYGHVYQYVIRSSTASLEAVPVGTQIGHLKIDYSTNGTDTTPEASLLLLFKKSAAQWALADVVLKTTTTEEVIAPGAISGYPAHWTVISVITRLGASDNNRWGALDWVHGSPLVKGPVDLPWGSGGVGQSTTALTQQGFSIFVNSNTMARLVTPAQIGSNLGSTGNGDDYATGWELVAENGGTLYLDDVCETGDNPETNENEWARDIAARLVTFTGSEMEEPPYKLPAGAKTWALYK